MSPERWRRKVMERVEFDTNGGCWLWTGGLMANGYGLITANPFSGRKQTGAHRRSYELFRGPVPGGMNVLHSCDVKACVNPAHLRVGTQKDNAADMDKRGRRINAPRMGERNGLARLTAEMVMRIRREYDSGRGLSDLGREFGVTPQNIRSIVLKKTWRHL